MVLYQDLGNRLHKTVLSRRRGGGSYEEENKRGQRNTGSGFSFFCFSLFSLTRLHSVICMKMYDEPKMGFVFHFSAISFFSFCFDFAG